MKTETIRIDIFHTIKELFGLTISNFIPIELGYMNLKWKIQTDKGDFFEKQYNEVRYPFHLLDGVETALKHQATLFKEGIPCPKLYSYDGKYLIESHGGERFVMMELNIGKNISPGHANSEQMYSLGLVVGKMHHILNYHEYSTDDLHWDIRSKESMIENWEKRWREADSFQCEETKIHLQVQRAIIEENDMNLFSDCEIGLSHWDLFVDNILFIQSGVSAILDFDRLNIVYRDFDISRPILSCCLHEDKLNVISTAAFVKGYRANHSLNVERLARSFKLTWWKEAEWVQVRNVNKSFALTRFCHENKWIAENWERLEEILCTI